MEYLISFIGMNILIYLNTMSDRISISEYWLKKVNLNLLNKIKGLKQQ